jgi:hypothetical protein
MKLAWIIVLVAGSAIAATTNYWPMVYVTPGSNVQYRTAGGPQPVIFDVLSIGALPTNTLLHRAQAGLGLTQTMVTNGTEILTTINLSGGSAGPVIASGIWGIWIDGTVSLLPVPLMSRSGYWKVEDSGWIGIADLTESDPIWTTNTVGELVLR